MRTLVQDLRFACRLLARKPVLTAVLVATLAIGIGATTAVFGIVQAALLRALPFSEPDRLLVLQSWRGANQLGVSWLDYVDWRDRTQTLAELACYFESEIHLSFADGSGQEVGASTTTRNLFDTLRVKPILGRGFLPQEAARGAEPVAILGYELWSRRFGADRGIVGRTVRVEGKSHAVVGVMPPGFKFPSKTEIWTPLEPLEGDNPRDLRALSVIGRLKAAVATRQARADASRIARQLAAQYPLTNRDVSMALIPLSELWVKDFRSSLLLLLGACSALLLIACANVANLLLARATSRQQEISLRTALGAGPSRIVRQLLTESVVLAMLGGVAGLLLASWGTRILARVIADSRSLQVPYWIDLGLDSRVFVFAMGISLLVGLLFGLAPALPAARAKLADHLREGARGSAGQPGARLRDVLEVAEVALALTLLIAGGLLGKSLLRLWRVDPGFRPQGVLTATVRLPFFDPADGNTRIALFKEVHRRLASVPGVVAVGADSSLPLTGEEVWTRVPFLVEGQPEEQRNRNSEANLERISPSYFDAMKIPLLRGRFFDLRSEVPGAAGTVIVSKRLAYRLWPGQEPLGKRMSLGKRGGTGNKKWWTVVAVVGDVKHRAIAGDSGMDLYVSYYQFPSADSLAFVMRTSGPLAGLAASVRAAVRAVSPELLVEDFQTLQEIVDKSLWHARLWGLLFGAFSLVALLLAAVGMYGVTSYNVEQRTKEIGVRLALGADRAALARLLLGKGMRLTATGVVLGLLGGSWLSRLLAGLLYQVSAADSETYLGISLALAVVLSIATWLPTRRALRMEPVIALKSE
jgi:putative ABC transport system permease protein